MKTDMHTFVGPGLVQPDEKPINFYALAKRLENSTIVDKNEWNALQAELERLRREVAELKARPEPKEKPREPYEGELCRMYDKELERWLIVYAHAPWNGEFQPLLDPNIIQLREHTGRGMPRHVMNKSGWVQYESKTLHWYNNLLGATWGTVTHYAVVEDAE